MNKYWYLSVPESRDEMPAARKKFLLPAAAKHPSPLDLLPARRRAILVAAVGVVMEKG